MRWTPTPLLLAALGGCALDPAGVAEEGSGGGDATTDVSSAATGPGSGGGATQASASSTSAGSTGGAGQGGAGQGGAGQGGAGQGGAGQGGAGQGGAGQGGAGGLATGGGGQGGAGGSGPLCGDGTLDVGEECDDGPGTTCDDVTCTWLGDCATAIPLPMAIGEDVIAGDTSAAPVLATFGDCNAAGPTALYRYTTGPTWSVVGAYTTFDVGHTLGDVVLSIHASCADATRLDECSDGGLQQEAVQTPWLPPFSTVAIAVSSFNANDAGTFELRVREYKRLLLESFDAVPDDFAAVDGGAAGTWTAVTNPACAMGGRCYAVDDRSVDIDYENELLTQVAPVDTTLVETLSVSFFTWADNAGLVSDALEVEASFDGASWSSVGSVGDVSGQVVEGPMNAFAGDPSVQVRFRYDDGGSQANYWYVDDVTLVGY